MFFKGRSPQDGARRGHIGVNLGLSWSMLGHLGAMSGHLESILTHVGVMLQPSWCQEASDNQKLEVLVNFTSQERSGATA